MGIFRDMHETRQFESRREYSELLRMLSEAISRGYVEQVAVTIPNPSLPTEDWYRDTETGEVFSLVEPEEKFRGQWDRVDL